MSRSAPAATRTTTTMPHLCQMPSLALPLELAGKEDGGHAEQ